MKKAVGMIAVGLACFFLAYHDALNTNYDVEFNESAIITHKQIIPGSSENVRMVFKLGNGKSIDQSVSLSKYATYDVGQRMDISYTKRDVDGIGKHDGKKQFAFFILFVIGIISLVGGVIRAVELLCNSSR